MPKQFAPVDSRSTKLPSGGLSWGSEGPKEVAGFQLRNPRFFLRSMAFRSSVSRSRLSRASAASSTCWGPTRVRGLTIARKLHRRAPAVSDHKGCSRAGRRVLWHNMREEPVIYVNGQPYVLREADKPFSNVEYTGIDAFRVEDMESRLKEDVLMASVHFL